MGAFAHRCPWPWTHHRLWQSPWPRPWPYLWPPVHFPCWRQARLKPRPVTALTVGVSLDVAAAAAMAVTVFPLCRSVPHLVLNTLGFDQTHSVLIFSVVTCLTLDLDNNTTSTIGLGDLIPR